MLKLKVEKELNHLHKSVSKQKYIDLLSICSIISVFVVIEKNLSYASIMGSK